MHFKGLQTVTGQVGDSSREMRTDRPIRTKRRRPSAIIRRIWRSDTSQFSATWRTVSSLSAARGSLFLRRRVWFSRLIGSHKVRCFALYEHHRASIFAFVTSTACWRSTTIPAKPAPLLLMRAWRSLTKENVCAAAGLIPSFAATSSVASSFRYRYMECHVIYASVGDRQ